MARSYSTRRFPGGPYIEPSVTPALRGPKRTGPIGELVPGDDVEVARILARLGRKPLREPVVYAIKLTSDLAEDRQIEQTYPDGFFTWPVEYDVDLLSLVYVSLHASTAAVTGDYVVQLRKIPDETRQPDEVEVDLLYPGFRLTLPAGMRHTKNVDTSTVPAVAAKAHEINLEYSQVEWGDGIRIDFDGFGDGRGLTIHFYFR